MKNSHRTAATKPRVAPPQYKNNLAKPSAKPSGGSSKPAAKPKAHRRISVGLVAASSAAIVAIYGFGYIQTQNAADMIAAQAGSATPVIAATPLASSSSSAIAAVIPTVPPTVVLNPTAVPTTFALTSTPVSTPSAVSPTAVNSRGTRPATAPRTSAPAAVPTKAAPPPTTVPPTAVPTPTAVSLKYKDGTFVGQGYSRHGGVEAAVVIKGGKIISANVRSCSTRFPCSAVDQLPPLVVQTQGPPVDYVSGATDSSMAYREAVINALGQAQGRGSG